MKSAFSRDELSGVLSCQQEEVRHGIFRSGEGNNINEVLAVDWLSFYEKSRTSFLQILKFC